MNSLTDVITNGLELTSKGYLEITEELFKFAESYSRSSDFTKADAYEGSAKVYKLKLKHNNNSNHQEHELQEKVNIFMHKSDFINKQLNRTMKVNT